MGTYTTIDQRRKMATKNTIFDTTQLCHNSLLCCIKFSNIVQRSYITVLTKQLRKQSTGTYITTSQTSKNRVFENYFSPLIDRCIRSHALFS